MIKLDRDNWHRFLVCRITGTHADTPTYMHLYIHHNMHMNFHIHTMHHIYTLQKKCSLTIKTITFRQNSWKHMCLMTLQKYPPNKSVCKQAIGVGRAITLSQLRSKGALWHWEGMVFHAVVHMHLQQRGQSWCNLGYTFETTYILQMIYEL